MTEAEFWKVIGSFDRDSFREQDDTAIAARIQARLEGLDVADIEKFAELLAMKLFGIDTQAHADNAGDSGQSDDGFLYARCFVVAAGRDHYERVLSDPSHMPKDISQWVEPLLYVAQRAWSAKTGKPDSEWDHTTSVSYESGSNTQGWREDR